MNEQMNAKMEWYVAKDGSEIIVAEEMHQMSNDAELHGWQFDWATDGKSVVVKWDIASDPTAYYLEEVGL